MAGEQQPRHRDRRIGEASDRIDEVVVGEALVAADVVRVQEQRRLPRRSNLPERVERGVVEIATGSFWLGRDHRAVKTRVERLFEDTRCELPVLQRYGGEREHRFQRCRVLLHVLVVEPRPVGALLARELVAVDIGPAADELAIDPRLLEPIAALRQIPEARLDRPAGALSGEFDARRRAVAMQPDRGEEALLALQRVEHRARHGMGMGVDDHAPLPLFFSPCTSDVAGDQAPALRNLTVVASDLSTSSTVSSGVVRVRTRPVADAASDSALAATLSGRSRIVTTSASPNAM